MSHAPLWGFAVGMMVMVGFYALGQAFSRRLGRDEPIHCFCRRRAVGLGLLYLSGTLWMLWLLHLIVLIFRAENIPPVEPRDFLDLHGLELF